MRDCEYYQELMSRLLDEALTAEEEAGLRAHVRTCPDCLRMFAAFTGMTSALRDDLAEPPEDLAPGVMARIAEEDRPSSRRRHKASHAGRRPKPWVRLGAAACLVLIVAGAAALILQGGRTKSAGTETASARAADMSEDLDASFGSAGAGADQPMAASLDGQDAASARQSVPMDDAAAVPEPEIPAPSPSSSPEPLPVYDAARNHIGTIPPENIPAFTALITDEGWAEGSFEYMLRVEYQNKTYAFAAEDDGTLVWWEEPSTQPLLSPGTFAQLHALIAMEAPALPQ